MKAASLSARLDRMPMVKAVAPFVAGILAADCFTLPLWFLAGAFLLSGTLALLLHSQSGALVMLLTVEEIIKKEQPDGILLAFGGQTALNWIWNV